MVYRLAFLFALIPLVSGCAATAKRPPSPATALSVHELLSIPAPVDERYYVMVFGSQTTPIMPRYTHSWATVVKVTCGAKGSVTRIEPYTISWMPATLHIHPWRFRVEQGLNLDLHASFEEALRHNERIAMWGPYEMWHGGYTRFVTQKAFLETGAIGYQCIDTIGEAARKGNGSDCIHAITDMDPLFDRSRYPLRYFGEAASLHVVQQIQQRPILIRPSQTHDWLLSALGLNCYPICRRTYTGPTQEFSPEAALEAGAGGEQCQSIGR
jgi:hypothetical protein